jgi:hypothetical protein
MALLEVPCDHLGCCCPPPPVPHLQSEIEETLERIKNHAGVEGYVIVNNAGEVLRKLPSLSTERAKEYGDEVMKVAKMAQHVVRDLDPKVGLCGCVWGFVVCRCRGRPWWRPASHRGVADSPRCTCCM